MNEVAMIIVSFVVTQVLTGVVIVAVMKNDNRWVKRMVGDHENRIRSIESGKRAVAMHELTEFGV